MINRRTILVGSAAALPLAGLRPAGAQAAPTIRIGILNDQSGAYRTNGGPGSVACARLALKEFGEANGVKAEILVADHQGKPDVGLGIARRWFDQESVDVVMDFQNSAIALAVANLAKERDKIAMVCNAGTTDLTGRACSPNTMHWAYDTYMLASVTGGALVKAGGDTWYFITADYSFGHSLERDTSAFVQKAGGRILGNTRLPFPTMDFSSALVQAQGSRAKVIGLANAGSDLVNCVKQAAEFGVTRRGTKLAGLLIQINDIHGLGLVAAQGLTLCESFYWDLNDRTRAFTSRVLPTMDGARPNMSQAACYSATLHYLRACSAMGAGEAKKSGRAVLEHLRAAPMEDDVFGTSTLRADGRVLHTAYLFEVKKPEESKGPWDYYKTIASVPAEDAFRPMAEGGCTLSGTAR
jgi:branched-chain amino acid transport system substrate-binding protein